MYCRNCGREIFTSAPLCPDCTAKEEEARRRKQAHDEWRAEMAQRVNQRTASNRNNYTQTAPGSSGFFCSNCGSKLNNGAAFCSTCGAPQGQAQNAAQPQVIVQTQVITGEPQKKKKPFYKRLWFWFIVLIAIGMFAPTDSDSTANTSNTSFSAEESIAVTIDETVIYETDGIRLTVTGIEDAFPGKKINLHLKNDTGDNISVGCDNFVVNGITIAGSVHIDAAAGKEANDAISFALTDLDTAGIEQIATIKSHDAYISNTDTYMKTKYIDFEINTSIADTHIQAIDESGTLLYNSNGITVISKGIEDNIMGADANILIKNETGRDIIAYTDNVSVNGFTLSASDFCHIANGTVRYTDVFILSSYLEENNIDTIQEVTFQVDVTDPTTFKTIFKTEELRISTQ